MDISKAVENGENIHMIGPNGEMLEAVNHIGREWVVRMQTEDGAGLGGFTAKDASLETELMRLRELGWR